jgi:hypothetical protein
MSILILTNIFFIYLIYLININRIINVSFNSFFNDLLNRNFSNSIYIYRFLYSFFNWNFNNFLNWNFYYLFYWSFFINFCYYISLYNLLNRSFYNNINWNLNLSIYGYRSFNNNLDFLFYKPLMNNSLFSCTINIHISSSLKITWSYLSILKSSLFDINILTISNASINFIRLTLSYFNNNSLSFCNLYNFWFSLLFRDELRISFSNL